MKFFGLLVPILTLCSEIPPSPLESECHKVMSSFADLTDKYKTCSLNTIDIEKRLTSCENHLVYNLREGIVKHPHLPSTPHFITPVTTTRHFHTRANPFRRRKFITSTHHSKTNLSFPHVTSTKSRLYWAFLSMWLVEGQICVELMDLYETDRFVWNWRIYVQVTDFGGWKGVALVYTWRVEVTNVWKWEVPRSWS